MAEKALGGKDRHPFPVPLRVYDQTIQALKSAVQKAKLGRAEELGALKLLDDQARQLEHHATGSTVRRCWRDDLRDPSARPDLRPRPTSAKSASGRSARSAARG